MNLSPLTLVAAHATRAGGRSNFGLAGSRDADRVAPASLGGSAVVGKLGGRFALSRTRRCLFRCPVKCRVCEHGGLGTLIAYQAPAT